jgi:F-type H+-transporting ATPase subunit gamma
MAGQQRFYRERIRSTQKLKTIFRAMELVAASRISRARDRVAAAGPYARALTRAVSAVASHAEVDHPLTRESPDDVRAAVLLITSDRGMAGAYSAAVLREGERLISQMLGDGKEVDLYVTGRRGVSYYTFRRRPMKATWTGFSDSPRSAHAEEIATTLLDAFLAPPEEGGVSELQVVYTHFVNMVIQTPRIIRMLPIEVVEAPGAEVGEEEPIPLYDFEPSPEVVLDALLPQYVRSRIHNFLLQAAASELAARQQAMHTATDNAEDLIRSDTRLANQARQAEITQEISEIVSGADALAVSR